MISNGVNNLFSCYVNNCGDTVDVLSYINFSNKTGLNSITEMQFPTSMPRDTPGMFLTTYFRWHFGIFKMCTNCFSNVIELLIFFMMLKNENVLNIPIFPTMCQQSKRDCTWMGNTEMELA